MIRQGYPLKTHICLNRHILSFANRLVVIHTVSSWAGCLTPKTCSAPLSPCLHSLLTHTRTKQHKRLNITKVMATFLSLQIRYLVYGAWWLVTTKHSLLYTYIIYKCTQGAEQPVYSCPICNGRMSWLLFCSILITDLFQHGCSIAEISQNEWCIWQETPSPKTTLLPLDIFPVP